jgi:hypothetical protein
MGSQRLEFNKKGWFLYEHLEVIRFFPEEAIILKLRFIVMAPVIVNGCTRKYLHEVLAQSIQVIFFTLCCAANDSGKNKLLC